MIQLLFGLIFAEMSLIVAFVFKTPLRKLVVMGLDRLKRGRGPIVVKTVAVTVFVLMVATVYNVVAMQKRWIQDEAEVNPTDQVIVAKRLLEASLMAASTLHNSFDISEDHCSGYDYAYNNGFMVHPSNFLFKTVYECEFVLRYLDLYSDLETECFKPGIIVSLCSYLVTLKDLRMDLVFGFSLFLALMVDRLHHYIRELRIRRKSAEAVKKQNRVFDDNRSPAPEEIKVLEDEMSKLRGMIGRLEKHLAEKSKEASSAEANATALKKQSEGFLLEYDRLLEENQNLRSQLQSLDRQFSFSDSKKVM
ncbi:hypothetical protein SASPL_146566 [Salvia splendens]|uniref:Endoplasmic reticulum transmembrane protein n=1 Tax=Salvia splendens TaxID=180675 RepID=A0A8X8WDV1_SALSN|nr:hypothetical protein SASPL_146566 [Salvia splendens]